LGEEKKERRREECGNPSLHGSRKVEGKKKKVILVLILYNCSPLSKLKERQSELIIRKRRKGEKEEIAS